MNKFKYRLPNASDIVSGESPRLIKGFGKGFVISPFRNPDEGMVTIPFDSILTSKIQTVTDDNLPMSTSEEDFIKEVEGIISALDKSNGKCVAARSIRIVSNIDAEATFRSLCDNFPDAFVFLFSTTFTGTWIGASPELLLEVDGQDIKTMALAGTRRSGDMEEWDEKNIEEQRMVTDFITEILSHFSGKVEQEKTFTKKAGSIEHICTPLRASLAIGDQESRDDRDEKVKEILCQLSPTPAVCGSDREKSLALIERYEMFDRSLYGGFCGPHEIQGKTTFFVNLRSAKCTPGAICVYAGCGVTRRSDPKEEWKETEIKSKTIINHIKI